MHTFALHAMEEFLITLENKIAFPSPHNCCWLCCETENFNCMFTSRGAFHFLGSGPNRLVFVFSFLFFFVLCFCCFVCFETLQLVVPSHLIGSYHIPTFCIQMGSLHKCGHLKPSLSARLPRNATKRQSVQRDIKRERTGGMAAQYPFTVLSLHKCVCVNRYNAALCHSVFPASGTISSLRASDLACFSTPRV